MAAILNLRTNSDLLKNFYLLDGSTYIPHIPKFVILDYDDSYCPLVSICITTTDFQLDIISIAGDLSQIMTWANNDQMRLHVS